MGHNAIMFVEKDGDGVIFSVFSTKGGLNSLLTHAELRFSALEKEKVDQFVNNNGNITDIFDMPATDGAIQDEKYDNLKMFEVSNEDGKKMFEFAVDRYDKPGLYLLTSENCDHFATDCLNLAENIDINKARVKPNTTFKNA